MEVLYDHVLKRSTAEFQSRIDELEAERAADRKRLDELEARLAAVVPADASDTSSAPGATINIDASVHVVNNVLVVNNFGEETTAHIPDAKIQQILDGATGAPSSMRSSAIKALCDAALLIYSDPDYPENITCYIPDTADGNAMVHTARKDGTMGWEVRPVRLVLPPMAASSLDLIFEKQFFEDSGQKRYEEILQHLRDSERDLSAEGSPCEASMRAVLIRNKDLLTRVLKTLGTPQ